MSPWHIPSSTGYVFATRWQVDAPFDTVATVLADLEHYPTWWPAVRRVEPVDASTATVHLRARLPYTLVCTVTRDVEDRERGFLAVLLEGDLEGYASWTLSRTGARTVADYRQDVQTTGTLMRLASPVAHPLFRLNHRWMMQDGLAGLRRHLVT